MSISARRQLLPALASLAILTGCSEQVARPSEAQPAETAATAAPPLGGQLAAPFDVTDAPPEGSTARAAFIRERLEAYLAVKTDYPVAISELIEHVGEHNTQLCGNMGTPDGDGEQLWFRLKILYDRVTDLYIGGDPLDCGRGRNLIWRYGEVVPADESGLQPFGRAVIGVPPPSTPAPAALASASDSMLMHIDRVTTYAVLLGRGIGCGQNVQPQIERVGAWMDRVAPPGSAGQQTLLPMLMQHSEYHAQQQASGLSPDSCGAVARAIKSHPWP